MQDPPRILVLGIGNILWADEGFGVRAVEQLGVRYGFPDNVRLLDGGTQGLYLIQDVREADVLVVLDAVDFGLESGTVHCVEDDAVPRYLGARKVSLHQTGFQEVLATAAMLGDYPAHLMLVGVQPECIEDYGGSLSEIVRSRIDEVLGRVLVYLGRFGAAATPCAGAVTGAPLAGAELDMARYEAGRPPPSAACRVGDERVLESDRYRVAPRAREAGDGALAVDVDQRDFR